MHTNMMIRVSAVICAITLTFHPAALAGGGKGNSKSGKPAFAKISEPAKAKPAPDKSIASVKKGGSAEIKVVISSNERDVIHNYVTACLTPAKPGKKAKGLPPGLAKKVARGGSLPPGWQKKFIVGEIIPPDVFKVCVPLPREVRAKLPPQPSGTVLVAIDGKVARVHKDSHKIIDVFEPPLP